MRKQCCQCDELSLKSMAPGNGLCQNHWNEHQFGVGIPRVPITVFTECANGVNLDGESVEALESFAVYRGSTEARLGHLLFTGVSKSTRDRAIRLCAHYADLKARAMRARMDGRVSVALAYEGDCERLYARLPKVARW